MKKLLFILFVIPAFISKAQDIMVKTDKTEVKVKVVEIAEWAIKYKNWDNIDGPLYNISKSDVFMIIYANGVRKIIKQADNPRVAASPANTSFRQNNNSLQPSTVSGSAANTTMDYKKQKIKYEPTRIIYWFQQPTTLGVQQELRIVKNVLNIGGATDYFMVDGYSQTLYSLYAAPYVGINRISGNYEKQDKGLFINGKIGYASLNVSIDGKSQSGGGVMYGMGADYFITRGFGLSLSGFKFSDSQFIFQGGICFKIL